MSKARRGETGGGPTRSIRFEKLESRHLLSADWIEFDLRAEFETAMGFDKDSYAEERSRSERGERSERGNRRMDSDRIRDASRIRVEINVERIMEKFEGKHRDRHQSGRSDDRRASNDSRRDQADRADAVYTFLGSNSSPEGESIDPRLQTPGLSRSITFSITDPAPPSSISSTPPASALTSTPSLPQTTGTRVVDAPSQLEFQENGLQPRPSIERTEHSEVSETAFLEREATDPQVSPSGDEVLVSIRTSTAFDGTSDTGSLDADGDLFQIDWTDTELDFLSADSPNSILAEISPFQDGQQPEQDSFDDGLRQSALAEQEITDLGILLDGIAREREKQNASPLPDDPGLLPAHIVSAAVVNTIEFGDAQGEIAFVPQTSLATPFDNSPAQEFEEINDSDVAQWTVGLGFYRALEVAGESELAGVIVTPKTVQQESNVTQGDGKEEASEPTESVMPTEQAVGLLFCCLGVEYLRGRRHHPRERDDVFHSIHGNGSRE